ncbi:ATP-dependent DNA helicase RecG [Candidatus Roizmanbacteria bacterium]|nr:ATP-dependent DNA helicase RecG [Candidatus Roizmanbacteria bacterium]
MDLTEPIASLPKTSSVTIKKLQSLEIKNYYDLINYFPSRYEDYSLISKIKAVQPGETVTLTGQISDSKYQVTRTGLRIQVFKLKDDTGEIELGFYNQPYLLRLFKKGMILSISGICERYGKKLSMKPKEYELNNTKIHTGRIIPIYPEKRGLSSKTIREKMFNVLNNVENNPAEIFPEQVISFNNLIKENIAYKQIHFPDSIESARKARERLAFDELSVIQLTNRLVKKEWEKEKVGNRFTMGINHELSLKQFVDNLPFKLTNAQKRVWEEISENLKSQKPMNRFLQGEVGSGKTVIAALACYFSYLNGYQSILMAPTEILALQHYSTIIQLFKNTKVKIGLQTGSHKTNSTSDIKKLNIIIGTHALISKKIKFGKIGLVIIDEQHRFGVAQRSELKNKGINPHLLTMTATPIPRTVALTLYGELDLSVIDEMPPGRKQVKTFFVPKEKRSSGYRWIKSQITTYHSQVFIVCPLIEESEIETMKSIKAAKAEYENLKKIFSEFNLGLLHGKIKSKEKNQTMEDFKNRKIDILVATPVVEVGVDIPNATIILIEGVERFGLAQLHQLRGRVGRSNKQSYCFLFTEKETSTIVERLKMFSKTNDGNKLAEEDLKIRGPGDIYGIKQHGYLDLKIASLSDYQMIEKTKKAVDYLEKHYSIDELPELEKRIDNHKMEEISKD